MYCPTQELCFYSLSKLDNMHFSMRCSKFFETYEKETDYLSSIMERRGSRSPSVCMDMTQHMAPNLGKVAYEASL